MLTNGAAVPGLGNIGPFTAKPVMEGNCCLLKKFAGVDVYYGNCSPLREPERATRISPIRTIPVGEAHLRLLCRISHSASVGAFARA
jgi:hypothetical protein